MATAQPPLTVPADLAATGTPTRVRYGVLFFLCTLSLVLYLDRVCYGQAEKSMREDLGLTFEQMGWAPWAFMVSYAFFEVPTGRLGDRYGSRGVLTRIVLWWSAFTALTGAVFSFPVLILVRFLFGAGEAGAYPNAARVVARWFPLRSRSTVQGMVNTSAQVGGAIAPVLTAVLIETLGWRWAFVIFGGVGVVWAVAFHLWYRDDPAVHPDVNDAERALIGAGRTSGDSHPAHAPIPWGLVLRCRTVWLMGLIMNCGAAGFYMYITWYATYLKEARGAGQLASGALTSALLTCGAIGSTVGGLVVDRLINASGNRVWPRRLMGMCGYSLAAVALLNGVHFDSPIVTTAFIALACFSVQMQIASWWGVVTDISGRHLGALFGLMNSLGFFGSSASLLLLPYVVKWLKEAGYTGRAAWDPIFYGYAAIMAVAVVAWVFVDPSKSAVEQAEPAAMS